MSTHSDDGDQIITFTPAPGFNIKTSAANFAEMMEEQGLPLVIELSSVSVEFEPGCTAKEIVDGYNQALKAQLDANPSSNSNTKKTKK